MRFTNNFKGVNLRSHYCADLSKNDIGKSVTDLISALGINYHYKSISRGVVDSRDVVYFLVATFVFIYATIAVLNRKGR